MAKLKDTSITGSLIATGVIQSDTSGASLTTIGTVKLNNSLVSTSDTEAATPSAIKQVKDTTNSLDAKINTTKSELDTTIANTEAKINTTISNTKAELSSAIKDAESKAASGIASTKTELEGLISKKENAFSKNSAFNKNYETNAANFKVAGTAAPGTLDTIARADHIHPPQTSVSGNSGSATKLATARNIALSGDVSGSTNFDGTANISIATTVADDSHNHSALESKTGGTIFKDHGNGNVTVSAAKDSAGAIGDLYIGYNTSTHFTKNVRLEAPVNWKGATSYIIDSNGKIDWQNLKNIPSAQNLGAVPLTGGTMTGPLTTTSLTVSGNGKEVSLGTGASDAFIRNVKSNKYLQLRDDGQISYDGKLIYHEGKKPSAGDVGALPLGGGAMSGVVSSSVTSGTYLAANKGTAIINSTAGGTGFNMLASMSSTNGRWIFGSFGTSFNFYYTAKSTIDAGTNGSTKTLTLINEAGDSSFPGTISATKSTLTTSDATPLTLRRTSSNANVNIGFDGNGTIKYLGCPKGELKFGSSEDLGSNGSTIWHAGNFDPNSKLNNSNGNHTVGTSWKTENKSSWIGYGFYGSQDCGIVSADRPAVLGGINPCIKYNNYRDASAEKFHVAERAHQIYGDNYSFRLKSSTAVGAGAETVSWTNASHLAGVVWSSAAPTSSTNNYPIGTIWVQY